MLVNECKLRLINANRFNANKVWIKYNANISKG
jgi:hypothetical protein